MLTLGSYRHPMSRIYLAFVRDGNPNRWPKSIALALIGLLTLLLLAGQLAAVAPKKPTNGGKTQNGAKSDRFEKGKQREREGSEMRVVRGIFKRTGDRFAFCPTREGKQVGRAYPILENLALERINRIYSEGGQGRFWTISGTLTEYGGANYLLISRATLLRKRSSKK